MRKHEFSNLKPASFARAHKIFEDHHGILRTAQAKRLGITETTLARMVAAGQLTKESWGLYRLASAPPLSNPDLVLVASRVPSAIICLISALAFHDLTNQIPRKVYIALPKFASKPRLEYPPLEVVRVSDTAYKAGIQNHLIDGISVPIYSPEKSIADCFKFRNKVGEDVALEALRNYLQRPGANIEALLSCAQIDRVAKLMYPYIRAHL